MHTPGADDHPHITYFDSRTGISFIWDNGSKIRVCPGGYGEPIVAEIDAHIDILDYVSVYEAYERVKTFALAYCEFFSPTSDN